MLYTFAVERNMFLHLLFRLQDVDNASRAIFRAESRAGEN